MNRLVAFLKLIRWPNLLFIVITQVAFYFFVFPYCYEQSGLVFEDARLTEGIFWVLVFASVVIAAAGYIINDYYDIPIDQINKPERVIISKGFSVKSAMMMYILLSVTGIFVSAFAGLWLRNMYVPVINSGVVLLLLFYSALLKKKFLIGNVIVSLLTAWVVLVLSISERSFSLPDNEAWLLLLRYSLIYGGFAFIISMIREVIKDMEDMEGDKKLGCTTMPIVMGIHAARIYTMVWVLLLAGILGWISWQLIAGGLTLQGVYGIVLLVLPLVWLLKELITASDQKAFHKLSSFVKLIMLAGILSMIFFKLL
ncbi:MAG: geranylgeranylglycerol-phosphate geranylgeranyltransferase [Chitinophagaceae bacterium]|nr:geranylgeranylglycerol-phosphate geranylgeranyltransferase [Chitinophagaceae bacterium]